MLSHRERLKKRARSPSHDDSDDSDDSKSSSSSSKRSCSREPQQQAEAVPFHRAPDGRLFNIDESEVVPRGFAARVYKKHGIKGAPVRPLPILEITPMRIEDDEDEGGDGDQPMTQSEEDEEDEKLGVNIGSVRKWDQMFEGAKSYYKSKHDAWVASKRLRTREDLSTDSLRDITNGQGDIRLANIYRMFEIWPVVRVSYQKYFHDVIIKSCLPKIYGTEWESNSLRVMKEHSIDKIDFEVLITTARRMGKTYSISMLACALLMCVPGIRIIIVSTGGRASSSLTETVIKFVEMTPGGKERIVKRNAEQLFIAPEGFLAMTKEQRRKQVTLDNTSKLLSFPR